MGAYLDKPVTDKETLSGCDAELKIRYAVSEMQGWRRNMEDAHIVQPNFGTLKDKAGPGSQEPVSLYGVFDGHGGAEVAKFCEHHLLESLQETPAWKEGDVGKALQQAFLRIDALLDDVSVVTELEKYKFVPKESSESNNDDEGGADGGGGREMVVEGNGNSINIKQLQELLTQVNALREAKAIREAQERKAASEAAGAGQGDAAGAARMEVETRVGEDGSSNGDNNGDERKGPMASPMSKEEALQFRGHEGDIRCPGEDGEIIINNTKTCDLGDSHIRSGCTACVACICGNRIYCANAGDSRGVLSRRGRQVPLSFDHKPNQVGVFFFFY